MKNLNLLTLAVASQALLAANAAGQTVVWKNDRTGAPLSSWTTGDRIRVSVTNVPKGYTLVLTQGYGIPGQYRDLATSVATSWLYAFAADSYRPTFGGINSYSILIQTWDSRGLHRYPISTLWRNN